LNIFRLSEVNLHLVFALCSWEDIYLQLNRDFRLIHISFRHILLCVFMSPALNVSKIKHSICSNIKCVGGIFLNSGPQRTLTVFKSREKGTRE
jgi:hypothetical protein